MTDILPGLFEPRERPPADIRVKTYDGVPVHYRAEDERVLTEVIDNAAYRKATLGFDVERRERWLDLGANIGAFAVYCRLRGATAECYEPDPDNFALLKQNIATGFTAHECAITNQRGALIPFWRGKSNPHNVYRNDHPISREAEYLPNRHGEFLRELEFDGVKMDIEGSEGGLLDDWFLPRCDKLVVEYHTSRNSSLDSLARRLELLQDNFREVSYPPEYDRLIARGYGKPFRDRLIFCMGKRK